MHANEINRCCEFLLHELCASVCVCVCGTHTRDTIHAYIRGVYTIRWNAKCNFNAIESIQNINGMKCTTHDSSSHKHSHTHTYIGYATANTHQMSNEHPHECCVFRIFSVPNFFVGENHFHIYRHHAMRSLHHVYTIHTIKIKIHSHIHSGECFSQNLSVSLFLFGMHRNHYSHMVGFCALRTPNGKVFNRHYSHCNMWVHAFMTAFTFILAFISLMISDFRMFGAFYGK